MKRIALAVILISAISYANAQNGNNICVFNAMSNYNTGGGHDELERGIKCSDEAAVNEATMGDKKTWFYRGELYTLVFIDTVLNKKYGSAAFEAVKAFKKLYDMNDPKFKDWEDVYKYLYPLGTDLFNSGVDQYQAHNYAQAYQYFISIKEVNAILRGKNKSVTIQDSAYLKNAAIMAENANMSKEAIDVYKEWLSNSPSAYAYRNYAIALRKAGQTDESKKIVNEGIAKYPKDANLLVEKINGFLEAQQFTEALTFVNSLLEVEPNNDGALFIKGLAFEKIGNEDSVIYYYKKSSDINPKNIKPLNNLGAWYVNKANALAEQMNKLGNSPDEVKKYNEMQKQRKALYVLAKPYLEKANAIDPKDEQIKRTLKQIELYTTGE